MPEENNNQYKLDYSLKTPQERTEYIKQLIDNGGNTSPHWLEIYTNYILEAQSKEEQKKREILTNNRQKHINKRETSYEGLAQKFENGEDGLHSILKPNDKNVLLEPKKEITEKDIAEVPGLQEVSLAIDKVLASFKKATGKDKYIFKNQLKELYQDRYILKEAYYKPIHATRLSSSFYIPTIDETITVIDNVDVKSSGSISFFNQDHVAALLRTFQLLKEQTQGQLNADIYYLVTEFEALVKRALEEEYPELYFIVKNKIMNVDSTHIQAALQEKFDITYSLEYISSLWRNKIPRLITDKAKDEYLEWYYTFKEYGRWKKCSCCGEIKLASTRFFSKNNAARDGLYSICKKCRSVRSVLGKKV